ncbi:hypothetical protein EJ05DRAFT_312374 [Pseudovirgaria hyperparasitica]|uniref:DUF1772-domain-containing protein n=1 Tax=Pseudovirgaria hyperparasitica TaxID=470096 RepID=A0A6A6WFH9_9PEZI|nr:uncharacterized protein EJ05DRAFT_312374 [Pseudovirgaria hyperparasitica]KAF2759871.1 hypothetical protein EJ05DRAFT_312374 [Pseudovirgaria hyperparasitica]
MSSTASFLASRPNVLPVLQATTITSLSIISGVSICLTAWVIPVIRTAREAQTQTTQFSLTIEKGWKYLHHFSQLQGASLATITYLVSQHPNPAIAAKWRIWAAALGIVAFAWPFERIAIFPVNDRVGEIGEEVKKGDEGRVGEVDGLLKEWGVKNVFRAALPLSAAVTGLYSLIF